MKLVGFTLLALLLILQYRLWSGDGSINEIRHTRHAIAAQQQENFALKERNLAEEAEVNDLKHGLEAIAERARNELGMVDKDEVFYQIVDE